MNAPLHHPLFPADEGARPLVVTAELYGRMIGSGVLEGRRVELRDGVIVEMNAQYVPHMRAKIDLIVALTLAIRSLDNGLRVDGEGSVRLSGLDVPEPDVFVWQPVDTRTFVPGEQLRLAVEVAASSLGDDLGDKANLYARSGIPEYWVCDVEARVVHRHNAPNADGYAERVVIRFDEGIESATIAGLAIDLSRIGQF